MSERDDVVGLRGRRGSTFGCPGHAIHLRCSRTTRIRDKQYSIAIFIR